jgi:hypothetical protein
LLLGQVASAQDAAFRLGSPYNGVPATFVGVTYPTDRIVIYDLPAAGRYAAVPETPDGFIDLLAVVNGGASIQAAGYGVILSVTGGGTGLEFDPEDVVGDTPNMGAVKNPTVTQNMDFIAPNGAPFGNEDVPGMIGGNQSIGIASIYTPSPPNQDTQVNNNHGLTAIPVDVDPGLTDATTRIKDYTVSFTVDPEFSGFVNTAGTILTNNGSFPQVAATVQIRQSRQGDMNGDGRVNNFDISSFVASVVNLNNFQTANPWLRAAYISDTNDDGLTNNFDIASFVQRIVAGSPDAPASSPSAIPEPSSFALALIGAVGAAVVAWRRRRGR